jgi:hypothetical protein
VVERGLEDGQDAVGRGAPRPDRVLAPEVPRPAPGCGRPVLGARPPRRGGQRLVPVADLPAGELGRVERAQARQDVQLERAPGAASALRCSRYQAR